MLLGFMDKSDGKSKSSNAGINDGDNDDAVPETAKLTLKDALRCDNVIFRATRCRTYRNNSFKKTYRPHTKEGSQK